MHTLANKLKRYLSNVVAHLLRFDTVIHGKPGPYAFWIHTDLWLVGFGYRSPISKWFEMKWTKTLVEYLSRSSSWNKTRPVNDYIEYKFIILPLI